MLRLILAVLFVLIAMIAVTAGFSRMHFENPMVVGSYIASIILIFLVAVFLFNADRLNPAGWFSSPRISWRGRDIDKTKVHSIPGLGDLVWSDEDDLWIIKKSFGGQEVAFMIDGETDPDEALIRAAIEITSDFGKFNDRVINFVRQMARSEKHLKPYQEELYQLTIESINPMRTEPNMILVYFRGPDSYRLWRCKCIDHEPSNLVFDD